MPGAAASSTAVAQTPTGQSIHRVKPTTTLRELGSRLITYPLLTLDFNNGTMDISST